MDRGVLVLDGSALANAFFTIDPSSVAPGSFDSLAGRTAPDRIETADVVAINRTMRARSAHSRWASLVDKPLPWLAAIDPALDLIASTPHRWSDARADATVAAALTEVVAPGRGVAVATKLLHLKRPKLFPVLDLLVAEMLGGRIPDAPAGARAAHAGRLVTHLRREGRKNLRELRAIQTQLAEQGIERSLVRVLDAMLWLSHPGAGSVACVFDCRLVEPNPD